MNRVSLPLVGAGVLCAAAVFSFGAAFVGALSVAPSVTPAAPDRAALTSAEEIKTDDPLDNDALLLAVDHDPFRPDRQRTPERYRLPGDEPPPPPPAPPPLPPPPPFRLIGTAITPTGGIAIIELENATRVLAVGESLLNYQLTSVESERVTMTGLEQELELPLVRPVANASNSPARGRGPQMPPAGRPAAAQNARDLLERIQSSGGTLTPQMLEMIQRLQAEGRQVEIRTNDGRGGRGGGSNLGGSIMIRTRPDTTETAAPRAPFNRQEN